MNLDYWRQIIATSHPRVACDKIASTKLLHEAASEWGLGVESPLATLFDRYVTWKHLHDTNKG